MRRRDLIMAGLAVGALGAAEGLRPRKKLKLLNGATVDEAIPMDFGRWQAEAAELVSPEQAGRLASSLYSEILMRDYFNRETGASVMLLAAYGDSQSDLLQLHRPESCYPAVGFTLQLSQPVDVEVAPGGELPARRVVAVMQDRRENIVYWTRMGEELPSSGGDQRAARLSNAMQGVIPDGVLVRCSVLGDSEASFRTLDAFIPEMLRAVPARHRAALVGTELARQIA